MTLTTPACPMCRKYFGNAYLRLCAKCRSPERHAEAERFNRHKAEIASRPTRVDITATTLLDRYQPRDVARNESRPRAGGRE